MGDYTKEIQHLDTWLNNNQDKQGTEEFQSVVNDLKKLIRENEVQSVASFVRAPEGSALARAHDPARGMNTFQQYAAGMGQRMTDIGLATQQMAGTKTGEDFREKRRRDESLLGTGPGMAGAMTTDIGLGLLTAPVPGINTYGGAIAAGTLLGAGVPTEDDSPMGIERRRNMIIGGTLGGAGKGVLDEAIGGITARQAGLDQSRSRMAQFQDAIDESIDTGYRFRPNQGATPTRMQQGMEILSGRAGSSQAMQLHNQPLTNSLAKKAIGLTDDDFLDHRTLQGVRNQAYKDGYEPLKEVGEFPTDAQFQISIDDISTGGGATYTRSEVVSSSVKEEANLISQGVFDGNSAIVSIRRLREKADRAYTNGKEANGNAFRSMANEIENLLERELTGNLYQPGMIDGYRAARQLIAKTHQIQAATNLATGNVDSRALFQQTIQQGFNPEGEIGRIARFGGVGADVANVPSNTPSAGLLDVFGFAQGFGGNDAAQLVVPARPMARAMLGRDSVQNRIRNPNYQQGPVARGLLGDRTQQLQAALRNSPLSVYLYGRE